MRTFIVPVLDGEDTPAYQMRVSSMLWRITGARELSIPINGTVMLDGDQPDGASFEEVTE